MYQIISPAMADRFCERTDQICRWGFTEKLQVHMGIPSISDRQDLEIKEGDSDGISGIIYWKRN